MVHVYSIPCRQDGNLQSRGEPAYYCCGCGYGPQMWALHRACSMCQKPACSNCTGCVISEKRPSPDTQLHAERSNERLLEEPLHAVSEGACHASKGPPPYVATGSYSDSIVMARFLDGEPSVPERIWGGIGRSGVAEREAEINQMLRSFGYSVQ